MKTYRISQVIKSSIVSGLALLLSVTAGSAQVTTNYYIYSGNQGGSPGTNWAGVGVTAYWKLNNAGTAVQPTNGSVTATTTNYNFYSLTNNGTLYGNGTATALIRNPTSGSTPTSVIFPGDSLILQTNASIRLKNLGAGAAFVTGVTLATPTNIFPGNFGAPGLVLNGGVINVGQAGLGTVIQGTMYAAPGSQSYLNPADTLNANVQSRAIIIQSQLTGSGAIVLLNAASSATAGVPTLINGTNNNFQGQWVIKSGWLEGAGDGTTDGYNSLGTNPAVSFLVDPQFNGTNTFAAGAFFYNGPSVLDMGPGLANSGGSLVLTNGGTFFLHGNVVFSNVTVEGTALATGTYSYATLLGTFPNNFAPGGSAFASPFGTLTVQAYGPAAIPAQISVQPQPEILYPGRVAVFTAVGGGSPPLHYVWSKNNVPLSDGGNVSGSGTGTLTLSGIAAADDGSYSVVVTNAFGSVPSAVATLQVVTPVSPYEMAVSNLNPVAYYQFNELADPASGHAEAFDYAGGFNGTYGASVLNGFDGATGPTPSLGFSGFATTNLSAAINPNLVGNFIKTPDWNLNANTVTMTAWVNPGGAEAINTGIMMCRGANTVAGLNYTGTLNLNTGTADLGYIWNNDPGTYTWDSGLVAPPLIWSMVTLVVTPSQATIYVMNTNGLTSSTHVFPHVLQSFDTNNTTLIGEDSFDGGNGSRSFLGEIDDVAVFNTALTGDQVAGMFYAATGTTNYAPIIGVQPNTTNVFVGQAFQLFTGAYGSEPLTYHWASAATGSGGPYVPFADGNGITGTTTATLNFASATLAQSRDYVCVVGNSATLTGVQSTPATVTVQTPGSPIFNITMSVQQAAGADWNTALNWSDGNPASISAVSEPGSIYELLAGGRLRSPVNATLAAFPGNELLLDGNGVFINNPGAGTAQSEFRTKQPGLATGTGSITFPLLVMNGGQLDNGNGGVADIKGTISIVSNAIFYVDNSGGQLRPIQLDAQLTGTGTIEYHDFDASMSGALIVTCPTNTFTGPWNVVQGLLFASSNSLGTNSITVATNGALQTSYDVNDVNSILTLSGPLFLTQTDTFYSVFLGSVPMPAGTYSAAVLSATYPRYFPSNWLAHPSVAGLTNAQGQITVLVTPGPSVLTQPLSQTVYPTQTTLFSVNAGGTPPLGYRWASNGVFLADGPNVSGSQTPTLTLTNAFVAEAASYTVVVTNALAGTTSQVATLTFLPTFPAIIPITLSLVETATPVQDWNSAGVWNDGQGGLPASTSALEFPGSTYEILPDALLRTPAEAGVTYTNFPGAQLQVDGGSAFVDGASPGPGQGEIRFKPGQPGVTYYFPLLILAGGQLDNGNPGLIHIAGNVEVTAYSTFYVDTSGDASRTFQVDAYLYGSAPLLYHDFNATLGGGLVLTCNSNNFTGSWFIDQGALIGVGQNSIGTNSIDINTNAALESLYDMHSPAATLSLSNGAKMFLHQNDNFGAVNISGVNLANGTYSFAQLNAAYPAIFPASWNSLPGSSFNAGSGSITVGNAPPPVTLLFQSSPQSLTLTWSQGVLLQATNVTGPWVTNTTATSPYTINPTTNAQQFFQIQVVP